MDKKVENEENLDNVLTDNKRREFLEKFGKLTAAVPAGMLLLMGPSQSKASGSSGNDIGG